MNPSLVLSFYFNMLFFSYQCTRNWSGLSAAECLITGGASYAEYPLDTA